MVSGSIKKIVSAIVLGGNCPGDNCPRWQLSGGKLPRWQLSRGNCPGGNCPGGNCPGGIVLNRDGKEDNSLL